LMNGFVIHNRCFLDDCSIELCQLFCSGEDGGPQQRLSWNACLISPAVRPVRILVADLITFAAAFAQYDALHYGAIGRYLASFA
jgi:hypothetical protein